MGEEICGRINNCEEFIGRCESKVKIAARECWGCTEKPCGEAPLNSLKGCLEENPHENNATLKCMSDNAGEGSSPCQLKDKCEVHHDACPEELGDLERACTHCPREGKTLDTRHALKNVVHVLKKNIRG